MTDEEWRGGLAPHYDYMLAERPADPEMRESASIWLYEENGEFGFPRIGIEAIGANWDHHRYDANFAFADGRALYEGRHDADTLSPIGPDGKPTILGSGGLSFQCIEPYRRWKVSYEGNPIDSTSTAMMTASMDPAKRAAVSFDVDLTMVTPCWVQDNTPEKVALMSERERDDARSMGLGYRMEHLFRGEGTLTIDGKSRTFRCLGSRIHRQSVRPLDGFRGHCWQSAVFPDGRAFGFIAYPPGEDGSTYNEGYVYQDGRMYPATASKIPFLSGLTASGEDVSLELEYELGTVRISGITSLTTWKSGIAEMPGFTLQQGGVRYDWDGQAAYGMIERSSWASQISG
ncbi:MAG: hypothetical protein ABWZ75_13010 [Novosphingobium sp.]